MTKSIEIIKKPRLALFELIKDLSIEQLNQVPPGFNNNIIWNLGHLVAAQQGICYRRAGVATIISEDFFNTYGPGSKPDRFISKAELDEIKEYFTSTLDQFVVDYNNNLFANYVAWTTRYGVDLNTIDDAFKFLPFHEGLHFGYVMAQRRALLSSI
jgi:hypothetical protein